MRDESGMADEVKVELTKLDGSVESSVRLLTGMSHEELEAVGGVELSGPITAYKDRDGWHGISPDNYRLPGAEEK